MKLDHPKIAELEEEGLKKIFEDIKIKERRSGFSEKGPAFLFDQKLKELKESCQKCLLSPFIEGENMMYHGQDHSS
jgi:hypothetical protein